MFRKFKKNKENYNLTEEELEKIKNRIIELKSLILKTLDNIKINPNDRKLSHELNEYVKELTNLKHKLKIAERYAKNRENNS